MYEILRIMFSISGSSVDGLRCDSLLHNIALAARKLFRIFLCALNVAKGLIEVDVRALWMPLKRNNLH